MHERKNNYVIQAQQAKAAFLKLDQQRLIDKLKLHSDAEYLYTRLLGSDYRIHRQTADIRRAAGDTWVDGNSFEETMTLLDLICDSKENRSPRGSMKLMQNFGLQFHQNLLEEAKNPFAEDIQRDPEGFRRGCAALGGTEEKTADIAYTMEIFDGLKLSIRFWEADEDFPSSIRWFWDENANQYIRYETMYFAIGLIEIRIREYMHS